MNRLLLAAIAGVALASSGPANAADLPRAAPVYKAPVVAPAFSWTGCYIGGNGGWIRNDSELMSYPSGGGSLAGFTAAQIAANTYAYSGNNSDFTAGVQYGCNRQYGPWVFGLDSDFNWSGSSESFNASHPANAGLEAYTEALTQKLEWFSTTRGKLGWAHENWMIFVAGGLARGRVESSYVAAFSAVTFSGSESKTRYGWTIGGGVEYALSQNWFLRGEYLYIDLGKYSYTTPPSPNLTFGTDVDTRAHVVRAALTYRITTTGSWFEWVMGGFKY